MSCKLKKIRRGSCLLIAHCCIRAWVSWRRVVIVSAACVNMRFWVPDANLQPLNRCQQEQQQQQRQQQKMRLQLTANKNVYFGFAGARVKFFNFSATSRFGFGSGIGTGTGLGPATGAAPAPDDAPSATGLGFSGVVRQLRSLLKIHTRRMQCRVEV